MHVEILLLQYDIPIFQTLAHKFFLENAFYHADTPAFVGTLAARFALLGTVCGT